jgi:hypothetical protein
MTPSELHSSAPARARMHAPFSCCAMARGGAEKPGLGGGAAARATRMAWLRRTCGVLAGGTAAAAVAGAVAAAGTAIVAAAVAAVVAAFCAAGITPSGAFYSSVAVITGLTRPTIGIVVARSICPISVWAGVLPAAGATIQFVIARCVAFRVAAPVAVLVAAPVAGLVASVAATYAQLPPPDAAASTAAASVTRHGGVAREPKPAGEGEQHEVSERVQGLCRPAATGPIRTVGPASGSMGRPVRLHCLPSRAPGDVCRLHLSRLSRHLRNPRAATVRWGEPVARGRRVSDSTVR